MKRSKIAMVLYTVSILLAIELCSGALIAASHYWMGSPRRLSEFRFHPLWTGSDIAHYESNWSETYPAFGYVNRINVAAECGYTTDKYGFIHNGDPARSLDDPKKFKIFILGGSTVAGHGASCNDSTITAYLEQMLQTEYPDVQVINAGVAGYYSPVEFLKLAYEIMFFKPDVVISFSGTNDFVYAYDHYRGRGHTYYVSGYQKELYKTLEDTTSLWWSFKNLIYNLTRFTEFTYTRFVLEKGWAYATGGLRSYSRSGLIENIKAMVGTDRKAPPGFKFEDEHFQPVIDEKIDEYAMYIRQTSALVTGMGKKYYFVLQPIMFTERRALPAVEEKALEIVQYAVYQKHHMDVIKRADYFWNRMDKAMSQSGISYYNLAHIFPDHDEIYSDYIHYNDHGNLLIAQSLYQMLMKEKALEQSR